MPVTEVGCMGVKPGLNVMDDSSQESRSLTGVYQAIITAQGGPQRIYWGLEMEDPSKIWAFFDFKSIEEHERFAQSFGQEAVKPLYDIMMHGEFTKHISLTSSSPLLSPMTQLLLAYFPSDVSSMKKNTATVQLQRYLENYVEKCTYVESVSCGWGVENDFPVKGGSDGQKGSILTALIGWSSVIAHTKFQETEEMKKTLSSISSIENIVKLTVLRVRCRNLERRTE